MPVESTTLPSRTEPLSSVVLISIDLYINREYHYEHAPTWHTEYMLQLRVVWFSNKTYTSLPINYTVARRVATGTWLAAHLNSVVSPYQMDAPLVDDLILEGNKQGNGGNSMLLLKLTNGIYVHIHIHTHRLSLTHIHSMIYKHKQMHITRSTIHACMYTPPPPKSIIGN